MVFKTHSHKIAHPPFFRLSPVGHCSTQSYRTPLGQKICINDIHLWKKWLSVTRGGTMLEKTFPFSIDFYGENAHFNQNIGLIINNFSNRTLVSDMDQVSWHFYGKFFSNFAFWNFDFFRADFTPYSNSSFCVFECFCVFIWNMINI